MVNTNCNTPEAAFPHWCKAFPRKTCFSFPTTLTIFMNTLCKGTKETLQDTKERHSLYCPFNLMLELQFPRPNTRGPNRTLGHHCPPLVPWLQHTLDPVFESNINWTWTGYCFMWMLPVISGLEWNPTSQLIYMSQNACDHMLASVWITEDVNNRVIEVYVERTFPT